MVPGQDRVARLPELINHLTQGFPLVGDIPVDSEAQPRKVREKIYRRDQLLRLGKSRWDQTLKRHSGQPGEDDDDLWKQTEAEASLGRMTKPIPVAEASPRLIARRFAVRQRDSKGRWKIRCVDDFAESLVNDGCSVSGRIRTGKISDLQSVLNILRGAGHSSLHLLKSDFKAAY